MKCAFTAFIVDAAVASAVVAEQQLSRRKERKNHINDDEDEWIWCALAYVGTNKFEGLFVFTKTYIKCIPSFFRMKRRHKTSAIDLIKIVRSLHLCQSVKYCP